MSEAFLGEIRLLASTVVPSGWMPCDGRTLPIAQYPALFDLIGATFGGDGQQTFALPDLRGRLPIGQGHGPGLSPRALGERLGEEQVALTEEQMPPHTHGLLAGAAAVSAAPQGLLPAAVAGFQLYAAALRTPQALAPGSVQAHAGGQPHNNLMPSLVLGFILCVDGPQPGPTPAEC